MKNYGNKDVFIDHNTARAKKAKAFDKIYCTQLLLKYWPELKSHCENIKLSYYDVETVEMQILLSNIFTDPDVFVAGLTRSKERTQIILSHVQNMISRWEACSGESYGGRIRRRIIRGLYLNQPRKTIARLALEEKKPREIIGKYQQSALKQLSALLFGVDGLLKTKEAMYVHTFEAAASKPGGKLAAPAEDNHAPASNP